MVNIVITKYLCLDLKTPSRTAWDEDEDMTPSRRNWDAPSPSRSETSGKDRSERSLT